MINEFKRNLGKKQQLGLFSTLGSPILTEVFAGCGFDWILIDTEHSPNELPAVMAQLSMLSATGISGIVRPAWSDMVLIKRILDGGAQTLLIPYIESAEDAARAVSYTRYPPTGVRGVSGSSRAARYGLDADYLRHAHEQICVVVQIETVKALGKLEEISAVDGVDAVFIGPSDLAASFGQLGNPQHPEVQQAITDAFMRLRRIGKPAGYLTTNETEAKLRIASGVDFVAIATDTSIITRGAKSLVERLSTKAQTQ